MSKKNRNEVDDEDDNDDKYEHSNLTSSKYNPSISLNEGLLQLPRLFQPLQSLVISVGVDLTMTMITAADQAMTIFPAEMDQTIYTERMDTTAF
jgi:hypothetical protein